MREGHPERVHSRRTTTPANTTAYSAHLTALAGKEGGANRAEKERKKEKEKEGFLLHPLTRGRWRVSGMILVFLFRASRAVIWRDRHDPLGNMALHFAFCSSN